MCPVLSETALVRRKHCRLVRVGVLFALEYAIERDSFGPWVRKRTSKCAESGPHGTVLARRKLQSHAVIPAHVAATAQICTLAPATDGIVSDSQLFKRKAAVRFHDCDRHIRAIGHLCFAWDPIRPSREVICWIFGRF
eukprot:3511196-Rhodomonas_salina.3